jgi:hypothetical protein
MILFECPSNLCRFISVIRSTTRSWRRFTCELTLIEGFSLAHRCGVEASQIFRECRRRQPGCEAKLIHTCLSCSFKNQGFLSTLDKCETTILFTTDASCNRQDHDVQFMLGIKVTVIDDMRQTVSPSPDCLVESLGSTRAGFLFSMLARYRLVDVVALMEGVCPYPTPIPRSPAPAGSIPVCQI